MSGQGKPVPEKEELEGAIIRYEEVEGEGHRAVFVATNPDHQAQVDEMNKHWEAARVKNVAKQREQARMEGGAAGEGNASKGLKDPYQLEPKAYRVAEPPTRTITDEQRRQALMLHRQLKTEGKFEGEASYVYNVKEGKFRKLTEEEVAEQDQKDEVLRKKGDGEGPSTSS